MIVVFILVAHVIVVARRRRDRPAVLSHGDQRRSRSTRTCRPAWFSARDIYFASVFNVLGPVTTRDSVMIFAQHGLGVCGNAGVDEQRQRGLGRVIAWALLVGFLVAAPATLWCQYSYPTPASRRSPPARTTSAPSTSRSATSATRVNDYSRGQFTRQAVQPALRRSRPASASPRCCEFPSLRLAGWPLLPVGYVASYGAFIGNAWFSILRRLAGAAARRPPRRREVCSSAPGRSSSASSSANAWRRGRGCSSTRSW